MMTATTEPDGVDPIRSFRRVRRGLRRQGDQYDRRDGGGGGGGGGGGNNRMSRILDRVQLEARVRRQEEEIRTLRKERARDAECLSRVRGELDEVRRMYESDARLHGLREEALRRQNVAMREEMDVMRREVCPEAFLARYAGIMRGTDRSSPRFASRVEAEFCRALREIEVLSDRVRKAQGGSDERVRILEEEVQEIVHEKNHREALFMKEIRSVRVENQRMREDYEEKLGQRQEVIEHLAAKLEEAASYSGEVFVGSTEEDDSDSSIQLQALKQQLNELSHLKETYENDFFQKLKKRDETIAMLKEVNAANEKAMQKVRHEFEVKSSKSDDVHGRKEWEDCNNKGYSSAFIEAERSPPWKMKSKRSDELLTMIQSLFEVTEKVKGDIEIGIKQKREMIANLSEDTCETPIKSKPSSLFASRESIPKMVPCDSDEDSCSLLGSTTPSALESKDSQ